MKKTIINSVALFFVILLSSCSRNLTKNIESSQNKVDDYVVSQTIQNFQIGYLDEKNNFAPINKNQLTYLFKQLGIYNETGMIEKFSVIEGVSTSTKNKKYLLQVHAVEGERKIKIRQELNENGTSNYIIAGESCTCSSTCTAGCESNTFIGCSCTVCGDANPPACTKTHTKSDYARIREILIDSEKRK